MNEINYVFTVFIGQERVASFEREDMAILFEQALFSRYNQEAYLPITILREIVPEQVKQEPTTKEPKTEPKKEK